MHYLIIANWKMYFTYNQAKAWIMQHLDELNALCKKNSLIICPSFENLSIKELQESNIILGAQDCSSYQQGAYTGQILAQSLQELGCSYCIVGHSELRRNCKQTDQDIIKKIIILWHHAITPILCIGESLIDYQDNQSLDSIEKQLSELIALLSTQSQPKPLIIAYEPVWSIGTGIIPEIDYLVKIGAYIECLLKPWLNHITIIYGGSVDSKTIMSLKKVPSFRGFLIGKARTDFQELKKIVLS